jgi:DNA polymerase-1
MVKTLLVVDGHSIAMRCFYALERSEEGHKTTNNGVCVSATNGFVKVLINIVSSINADHILVAFDSAKPTFRHSIDPSYKAGRTEKPYEFLIDLEILKEVLKRIEIPFYSLERYEADDIIATAVDKAINNNFLVRILTTDRDLYQLVNKFVNVVNLDGSLVDRHVVKERLGVYPEQVIDYKALAGDSADNIKGVPNIGPKKAAQLLYEFNTLDAIYNEIDSLSSPGLKDRLIVNKELAYRCKKLATIVKAPIEIDLLKANKALFNINKGQQALTTLGLEDLAYDLRLLKNYDNWADMLTIG